MSKLTAHDISRRWTEDAKQFKNQIEMLQNTIRELSDELHMTRHKLKNSEFDLHRTRIQLKKDGFSKT